MCGRFTLATPAHLIEQTFGLFDGLEADLAPRYNIAPTQNILALRVAKDAAQPTWTRLRWGLIPSWAEDKSIGNRLLNARADGIESKPSFRAAFKRRRCLIVADGFYEWKAGPTKNSVKQPYHIRMKDRRPFAFAGLWEYWDKGETPIESCVIITTEANAVLQPLHDRMPVIVDPGDFERWLIGEAQDPGLLLEMLRPYAAEPMEAVAVSTVVNKATFDDPSCLAGDS